MTCRARRKGEGQRMAVVLGLVLLLPGCVPPEEAATVPEPVPEPTEVVVEETDDEHDRADATPDDVPVQLALAVPDAPPVEPVERVSPPALPSLTPRGFRVGLLVPLSGDARETGEMLVRAAELSMFEAGVENLVLLPRDTAGDPELARDALLSLGDEEVELVIGPLFADTTASVIPVARSLGIPVLSLTNDITRASSGAWTFGLHPAAQVDRVIAHAASEGRVMHGLIVPDTPYGMAVSRAFREALPPESDAAVVIHPAGADFGDSARAFLDRSGLRRKPDGGALLLALQGETLRGIAAELAFQGADPERVLYLGLSGWRSGNVLGEPALSGGRFVGVSRDDFTRFGERYQRTYGHAPLQAAALVYDATALAAFMAASPPGDVTGFITSEDGFRGLLGTFRLRQDGNVERALGVYEVTPAGTGIVEPAPLEFASSFTG